MYAEWDGDIHNFETKIIIERGCLPLYTTLMLLAIRRAVAGQKIRPATAENEGHDLPQMFIALSNANAIGDMARVHARLVTTKGPHQSMMRPYKYSET